MSDEIELERHLSDPMWRLTNLYYILDKSGKKVLFKPNAEQADFLENLWYRNTILKARQLGFSTLIQLMMLDACLFTSDIQAQVIAQTLTDVRKIFDLKIKYAYDNLPESIKARVYPVTDSKTELELSNGSKVSVGVSARGGTLQYLHISEFGKICATAAQKAREIVTGAIEAVPPEGFLFIESTAEGRAGYFYEYCTEDQKRGRDAKLDKLDRRFHFYSWVNRDEYQADPSTVTISEKDHKYFDEMEAKLGQKISLPRRAWYVKKKEALKDDMKREYPTTPEEAFEQGNEGAYYREQFIYLRKNNRICSVPYARGTPVNTFWDLGANDMNAIWFHQRIGLENRFIRYYENSGETLDHYVEQMQKMGYVWGTHYLPHDANHKRLGSGLRNMSIKEQLAVLGLQNLVIVGVTPSVTQAINQTRAAFDSCWFDAEGCKEGLLHLENYTKEFDVGAGTYKDRPKHDVHSNGADAFRQFGQVFQVTGMADQRQAQRRPLSGGDSYGGY